MPTLRINQHPGSAENRHRVEIGAEGVPGFHPQTLSTEIELALSPHDRERIRWYLEDFLLFDQEPAPQIAKRVEDLMAERGETLFRDIFDGSRPAIQLWTAVQPHLSSTRIEVTTGIAEAMAIPWELIRNPETKMALALSAQAFVRAQRGAPPTLAPHQPEAGKVRILLVICRPQGGEDVPFRSVAGRLVTRLSDEARGAFDLDVLRPPTFEQLAATLRLAKEQGRPYHVVHFDGHGTYSQLVPGTRPRGYLWFEGEQPGNQELIHGGQIGELLSATDVPALVLNACQSAYAESRDLPRSEDTGEGRTELAAYGSLAQEVINAGTPGVVAMRYSVYVVTAAQFVAELYGALARGRALGEAVSWARKTLADQPERRIAYDARPLQDWSVPMVWERAPLQLWPEKPDAVPMTIMQEVGPAAQPGTLDATLPARPNVGFYGRDETLYALDRSFDTQSIVLLQAYAGSGKSATAAEFGRWYALTGGVEGPVLFSSFERHLPLARVLDKIGTVFGPALEGAGVQWDAITDTAERRDVALQVLSQMPVLWIWDNVEPVTGFPAGTESEWSAEEQEELRAFLTAARDTKAKVLLTSRRDERAWLGGLVRRVSMPPMPMQERLQLAGAILEHRGQRLAGLPDLTPLLRFTHGNPLTILVTVGEALRTCIDTQEKLDNYVERLRGGEAAFEDEASEGRAKSLGASLSYGFAHAFSADERKVLALLHLFHGFVNVDTLRHMGHTDARWRLEEVRGLTREHGLALLDRAAEAGLLTAHGGGTYTIHPALPWYFRDLFERHYPTASGAADRARRAFVEVIGDLGTFCTEQYQNGNRDVLSVIVAEENNLLATLRLARIHAWWNCAIGAMQGLRTLYDEAGPGGASRRLFEALVPDLVEPATDGPRPGREGQWPIVTEYRVRLAQEDLNWVEAERLQRLIVDWNRNNAGPALKATPETRDAGQRHAIRNLASSIANLAWIQLSQKDPVCADSLRESLDLAEAIGDTTVQAMSSFYLGLAYKIIAELRDLDEAERWCRRSLDLFAPGDAFDRGKCLNELGKIAFNRFLEARLGGRPVAELSRYLADAAQYCEQALKILPGTAALEHAGVHDSLGIIYINAGSIDIDAGNINTGNIDRALHHFRQTIRFLEQEDDLHEAGKKRANVAVAMFQVGRDDEARAYAKAALANFRTFGDRASADIEEIRQFMSFISQAVAQEGDGT